MRESEHQAAVRAAVTALNAAIAAASTDGIFVELQVPPVQVQSGEIHPGRIGVRFWRQSEV
jgi:hypothetical protein